MKTVTALTVILASQSYSLTLGILAYRYTSYHGQDDKEDDKMATIVSLLINIAFGLTPLAFIFILYVIGRHMSHADRS
jgi:hypothetical protein